MSTEVVIPTTRGGVVLKSLSEQADMALHVAKRATPHPKLPNQRGAPEWAEFTLRRKQLADHPEIVALGIWDHHDIVGEIDVLPASSDGRAVEIGYHVLEAYRRQGYATLAARAAAQYAIAELAAEDVFARTLLSNHASQVVLKLAGFVQFTDRDRELYFTYDPERTIV
jgi:ribosomal-protein-alanine N-acetyltransferase